MNNVIKKLEQTLDWAENHFAVKVFTFAALAGLMGYYFTVALSQVN